MKQLTIILILTLVAITPTVTHADDERLPVKFSLLIGFPGEADEHAQGVLIVPGTVIPQNPYVKRVERDYASTEEARSAELATVAESLRSTLRLSEVAISYDIPATLAVDEVKELPPPAGDSGLTISVKLLGFNDESASFQVVLTDPSGIVADPKVTAIRGQRAIVGGLDGEEAPYVFLAVEPKAEKFLNTPTGRLKLDDDVTPPQLVHKVPPQYNEVARKEGIQGIVIVQAHILKDGSVGGVDVIKELSHGLTEQAAEAVKQWRFAPATLEGEPVEVLYNLTIRFRLE